MGCRRKNFNRGNVSNRQNGVGDKKARIKTSVGHQKEQTHGKKTKRLGHGEATVVKETGKMGVSYNFPSGQTEVANQGTVEGAK